MTAQTHGPEGADDHPSRDQLAEYAGDALDKTAFQRINGHLAGCEVCRRTVDSVAAVTTMLRDAPAEVPVPADVAARIGAAIENAADERAADLAHAEAATSGGPVAWFRRRMPRVLVAAASVGVLALAGYVAVSDFDSGGDDDTAGSTGVSTAQEDATDDEAGGFNNETTDEASDVVADEAEVAAAPEPGEIRDAMLDVYDTRERHVAGCGRGLANEQHQKLIGSADLDKGMLVVLEADDGLHGWLLPTCNSLAGEAIVEVEDIPAAELP